MTALEPRTEVVSAPDLTRVAGRLTGKVALIVGGGATHADWPGTGTAMARMFAAAGATVAVMGRTLEKTDRTVRHVAESGGEAIGILGDATMPEDVERVAAELDQAYGRLDVLVNNVGISAAGGVADIAVTDWDHTIRTNLTGVLLVTKAVEPLLAAAGGASVINIGSVAGVRGSGGFAYGTTKGALVAMSREMALDLGPRGIRVNLIHPGHLHTPSGSQFSAEDARRMRTGVSMLGIEGTAWDIAWAALFLAGDESRFVTSQTLTVDGGAAEVMPLVAVARARAQR